MIVATNPASAAMESTIVRDRRDAEVRLLPRPGVLGMRTFMSAQTVRTGTAA